MASTPILPLAVWQSGTNQNSIPANDNALRLEALNREIVSQAVTAQPASPTDGDTYILAATHTGAQWSSFTPLDIVIFKAGTWYAWAPTEGLLVNVAGDQFKFDGGAWVVAGGGGGGAVSSVNSQTGVVVLDTDDISEGSTNLYLTPERVQDIVGAFVVAGTNMTITYDDVSNTLTFAASGGGGGGLTNWTEAVNTTSPNGTVPVVSFSATDAATNVDAALIPKGTGAILADVPTGDYLGGNKRGPNAVDLQMVRSSGAYVASGTRSVVPGGQDNLASGAESYAMGQGSQASGSQSSVLGGIDNRASGPSSVVTHGEQNLTDSVYGRSGGAFGATRGVTGADVWGNGVALGTSQRGSYMLRRTTASATPSVMTAVSNSASPSASNQLTLPDSSAYTFTGMVVAKTPGTTDSKHWTFSGGIVRGSGAGTVALVGSVTPTVVGGAAGMSALAVTVGVNTSLGCLEISAVGDAFAVNWSCSIETCEVTT